MGRSAWLDDAIAAQYLPFIGSLKNTQAGRHKLEAFTHTVRQEWSTQYGKGELHQQQRLMDQVRRAIKDALGEDHWSLEIFTFSTQEYIALNDRKHRRVEQRNEQVQQLQDPDTIVATAVRLLDQSKEWADIAAALALLTGRRSAELLVTASFEFKSHWSVTFRGALKRPKDEALEFEIPTLTTAQRVIAAIAHLRQQLPQATQLSPRDVNAKYGQAVARACDQHFAHLIPSRSHQDSLYTHLFRAIYATIATFYYCPPAVQEAEFKAAIQGHFQVLSQDDPSLKRTLTANRHYSDYEIADAVIAHYGGKRRGVKLGHAGVQPIEMFKHTALHTIATDLKALPPRRPLTQLRIFSDTRDRWSHVLQQIKAEGTQPQQTEQLLEWIEAQLHSAQKTQDTVSLEQEIPDLHPDPTPAEAPSMPPNEVNDPDPLRHDLQQLIHILQESVHLQRQLLSTSTPDAPLTRPTPSPVALPAAHDPHLEAALPTVAPRPVASTPALPQPTTTPDTPKVDRRFKPDSNNQRLIDDWIAAIMAYNNHPGRRFDDLWAITLSLLKRLGGEQQRIINTLNRRSDVQAHHQALGIDPKTHNLRHRGKQDIAHLISFDP